MSIQFQGGLVVYAPSLFPSRSLDGHKIQCSTAVVAVTNLQLGMFFLFVWDPPSSRSSWQLYWPSCRLTTLAWRHDHPFTFYLSMPPPLPSPPLRCVLDLTNLPRPWRGRQRSRRKKSRTMRREQLGRGTMARTTPSLIPRRPRPQQPQRRKRTSEQQSLRLRLQLGRGAAREGGKAARGKGGRWRQGRELRGRSGCRHIPTGPLRRCVSPCSSTRCVVPSGYFIASNGNCLAHTARPVMQFVRSTGCVGLYHQCSQCAPPGDVSLP